jgi:hypothetical protein
MTAPDMTGPSTTGSHGTGADRTGSRNWQDRLASWAVRQRTGLFSLESVVGVVIVTLWAVLAGAPGGVLGLSICFGIGLIAHWLAIETGSHGALWASTVVVLGLILIAGARLPLPPLALTVMTGTALVHNEMIRINGSRRRAQVDIEVFHASALAVVAAVALAIGAVALAVSLSLNLGASVAFDETLDDVTDLGSGDRSWLWVPLAVGSLVAVAAALAALPALRSKRSANRRWQPGERLPPPPLSDPLPGQAGHRPPPGPASGSGPGRR